MQYTAADEIRELYQRLIQAWNNRHAAGMSKLFTENGELIGFDGSIAIGQGDILAHLAPIFASHPTPPYICEVKAIRSLGADVAVLRAIAGMIPPGQSDLLPDLNCHQTVVAVKKGDEWRIELFQNTPAQFHGRPELVAQMTLELKQAAARNVL